MGELKNMEKKKKELKIRSAYDYERGEDLICKEESMTMQQFADECDINNIIKKYSQTGIVDHTMTTQGIYGDFDNVDDYLTSMNKVISAQEAFSQLPSSIRERFANDPAQLLNFIVNDENREEAEKLGLVSKKITQQEIVDKAEKLKE